MGCTHATPVSINAATTDMPAAKSERTLRKTSSIDINDEKSTSPALDVQLTLNTSSLKDCSHGTPNDIQELVVVDSVTPATTKTNSLETTNSNSTETPTEESINNTFQIDTTDSSITTAPTATSDDTTLNIFPMHILKQPSMSSLTRIFQASPASETEIEALEYAEPIGSSYSNDTPVDTENPGIPQDDGPLIEESPEIDESFTPVSEDLSSINPPTARHSDNETVEGTPNVVNLNSSASVEPSAEEKGVNEPNVVNSDGSSYVDLIILPDVCSE